MEEVKAIPAVERGGLYEWDTIFDGKLNMLTEGKDFKCGAASFASNARNRAERLGIKLKHCVIRKDKVFVQAENGR